MIGVFPYLFPIVLHKYYNIKSNVVRLKLEVIITRNFPKYPKKKKKK